MHVEDGGWVNADGDFGSPQYINWNWPLVNQSGDFDIPAGWAEDERNWAVLIAAQNRVETACANLPAIDPAKVVDPLSGAHVGERAWHYLLAGYESGYMYYGAALDMEIKPTMACNKATALADPVIAGGGDTVSPTVWLPQRLPWNPGGQGGGALWGYPGGQGTTMPSDFHVWTFVHDVSGLARIELMVRTDTDGTNSTSTTVNEVYSGGAGVTAWAAWPMTTRAMPTDEPWPMGEIDFTVLPTHIADQAWVEVTGFENVLLDYYIEAEDTNGLITRSPIQHVWVGDGTVVGPDNDIVWTVPETLTAGSSASLYYDPAGGPLQNALEVLAHWGINDWTQVIDSPMTWDATEEAWRLDWAVPASATVIDLVLTDGVGAWDNNGGSDWHLTVTGGEPEESPFVMDGVVDDGVTLYETCGAASLWLEVSEPWIYVATNAPTAWPSEDVFLLLGSSFGTPRAAPWSKTGQVKSWDAFLASESTNGWRGWFDAVETTPPAARSEHAGGTVLEGVIHLDDLYPGVRPQELLVALAGYGTGDAGLLNAQCPAGNGDGDLLDTADYLPVWVPVGVEDDVPLPAFQLSAAPNPFNGRVEMMITGAGKGVVDMTVHDASGRVVRRLTVESHGDAAVAVWDGRDSRNRHLPSGVYFVRAVQGHFSSTMRLTYLK